MSTEPQQESRVCPVCGTANAVAELGSRQYRCSHCKLELAHLDVAANGAIRGVFGWLHAAGDVVVDRYQVKSVLGKGGFGATYLVEDLKLSGKRRALKEVPELLFDEYETTLLSRLNHPAIPDIIDRSAVSGMVYLVLEFGGSRTLSGERKRYADGRIPLAVLVPWMRQLCEVLIYLHAQQPPIIHRDLKPENVLLDENDRVMLIDFGIAKEAMPSGLTRTLGRAATQGFSPPEQAMGTGTDERSDIYSLGATFYASLTGQSPPAAHERVAGKELVPPSQTVAGIPAELDEILLRALDLNVNHRPQSVKEFGEALGGLNLSDMGIDAQDFQASGRTVLLGQAPPKTATRPTSIRLPSGRIATGSSRPIAASPPSSPWRNARVLVLVAAAVLLSVSLGWYFLGRGTEGRQAADHQPASGASSIAASNQPPVAQFSATPVATVPLSINFDASASRDPDGKIAAYVWEFGDGASDNSGLQWVQHAYKAAGAYVARLTITDEHGVSSTVSLPVTVNVPAATTPLVPTQQPLAPAQAGSAQEWLKTREAASEAVAPAPVAAKTPAVTPKRSRPITSAPKPAKAGGEGWTIIPGQTRRTD
jgi:serine/threonine-protein kinase